MEKANQNDSELGLNCVLVKSMGQGLVVLGGYAQNENTGEAWFD